MTASRAALAADRGTLAAGLALAALTAVAWLAVVRGAHAMPMPMPGAAPSLAQAAAFTAAWGVMMAAMMLPGAAPTILLYRTVSRRLAANGERAIPPWAFAGVYLGVWTLLGAPVYAAYLAVGAAAARWPAFGGVTPWLVATSLAAAGVYQLTAAKRACLRRCESPLEFLMKRWRSGYRATFRLAAEHAAWCVGCCWGLMLVLVAAGAMSLPWVLVIALAVTAEKLLPQHVVTTRVVGAVLLAFAMLVATTPRLAGTLRGGASAARPSPSARMHMGG